MQLTMFTDYALRVLMYADGAGGRLVTVDEIARAYGVSHHHLTKVVSTLTRANFLIAVLGRSGGLRLARPAADIRLGDVVRATEPDFALVGCQEPGGACVISPICRLPVILEAALRAFFEVLDQQTLASVALKPNDFLNVFPDGARPVRNR
jgi:Rrf2 family transcriptional regulator, nitric oxide-sensitive transcriptional repressor